MLARRTIEGEVQQVIPPDKLDRYAIWGRFEAHVREQYVIVVRADDRTSWLQAMIRWIAPWKTVDAPVVVASEADVQEGDRVRIEVAEVEDHEDVWVPVDRERCIGSEEVIS